MTPPEVPVSLTEIGKRIEKATKGDWIPVLVRGWEFGADVITLEDPDPDGTPYVIAGEIRGVDAAFIAACDPPTVLALIRALRIAVEGLEPFEEFDGTLAAAALAAVRELVDLGGDDG